MSFVYNPDYDMQVLLRSCEQEIIKPLEGKLKGTFPNWLQGTLLRNGPGSMKVGSDEYKLVFEGAALLHKFAIKEGQVTYQCRFLSSNTLKKNRAANRIVVTEFGTKSVPDPCHTIFDSALTSCVQRYVMGFGQVGQFASTISLLEAGWIDGCENDYICDGKNTVSL